MIFELLLMGAGFKAWSFLTSHCRAGVATDAAESG